MSNKDHELKLNIHQRGITYVRTLLERSGFTVHTVHKGLDSPSQLWAKAGERSLLIAVRTACHPDAGRLDEEIREKLLQEAEQLDAVPYFAAILLTSMDDGDILDDEIAAERAHKVIFNGMSVVR